MIAYFWSRRTPSECRFLKWWTLTWAAFFGALAAYAAFGPAAFIFWEPLP